MYIIYNGSVFVAEAKDLQMYSICIAFAMYIVLLLGVH